MNEESHTLPQSVLAFQMEDTVLGSNVSAGLRIDRAPFRRVESFQTSRPGLVSVRSERSCMLAG